MKVLLVMLTLFLCAAAYSQQNSAAPYQSAIGAKISSGVAISYKTFVTTNNALEAQTTFFKQGIRLVGLYEFHHFTFNNAPGLGWYLGPGAHVGFWKKDYKEKYNSTIDIGVDGVIGLDYKIPSIPINLSLDWQPSLSLLGNAALSPQYGGIAIRYVLP